MTESAELKNFPQWEHVARKYIIRIDNSYIVVIDPEGDLDWEYELDPDVKVSLEFNSVINRVAQLEVTPTEGLKEQACTQFKRLLGEALATNFEGDFLGANAMIAEAEKYIRERTEEVSRLWYLSASAMMAAPFIVLGALIWIVRNSVESLIGHLGLIAFMAACAGAVGALLSVILRTGELKFSSSSGQALIQLEGVSRIWAGGISGVIVGLSIEAGLILGIAGARKSTGLVLVFAVVAGAAERFASSIISEIETSKDHRPAKED